MPSINNDTTAKKTTKKHFRWGYILAAGLICFAFISFAQQYERYTAIKGQQDALEAELDALQQKTGELQDQKDLLYNDTYLNKLARETLGMVKKGEIRVLTIQNNDDVEAYDDSDKDIH